jgi:hypothetical protein
VTIPAGSDSEQVYQDTDLLLRIAQAVMAPGETRGIPLRDRMDPEGQHHKDVLEEDGRTVWRPVVDLVAEGEPFMVVVPDDLLVLDADNPAQVAALQRIARELEVDEHRHVIVQSGRPGNRQLWARVGRGYRAQVEQRLRVMPREEQPSEDRPDTRGCRMVRPPLSPHPAGYPVALEGVGLAEAVSILQPMTAVALVDRLGRTARDALEHGAANRSTSDCSRSGVQFTILLGCVRAGMTFAETERLFSGPYAGTEGHRRRVALSIKNARRKLHKDYQRAQAKLRDRVVVDDPQSARVALANVKAHADAQTWAGRGRPHDRAVLDAHIALAARQGRIYGYYASHGQLAVTAGVSKNTVKRANARLIEEGWFTRLAASTPEDATTWAFTPAVQVDPPFTAQRTRGGVIGGVKLAPTRYSDDIWRPVGLGHAAGYVASALTASRRSTAELTEILGYARGSASTVRRHLRRLEAVGLAHRTAHGWTRGQATVVEAAETARCTGESEWYERQYERQQKARARKRARAKAAGMPVLERYVDLNTGEITTDLTFTVAAAGTPRPWPYEADGQMHMAA